MTRQIIITIFVLLVWTVPTIGQTDSSCFAIKMVKNGEKFKERKHMNTFSKKGFYIYKNYFYNLDFTDSVKVFGKIIDITNDSLYITTSFNDSTAKQRNIKYDTLKYSIRQIRSLELITEDIYGFTRNIDLKNYSLQLVKMICCNEIAHVISSDKQKTFDCYPYLTNNGVAFIYENGGLIWTVGAMDDGK